MKNIKNKKRDEMNYSQKDDKSNNDESPYYDDNVDAKMKYFSSAIINPNLNILPNNNQQTNQQGQRVIASQQNIQPSMLQYKLQRLLHQSMKREQQYQTYIKKKQQQSYQMTQHYLSNLKRYKQQLDKYMQEKGKKKQQKFNKYKSNKTFNQQSSNYHIGNKQKLQPYYPIYSQNNKYNVNHKVDLKCKFILKSFTPIISDYLKQKYPLNLNVQIKLPLKNKFLYHTDKSTKNLQVSLRVDEDQNQNIQNLIYGYPFNLYPSGNRHNKQIQPTQGLNMEYSFTILNDQQNIQSFDNGKVWVNIYDRDSQILFAYSSISSQLLLYYHKQSKISSPKVIEETQILQFYSPYTHKKNCTMQVRIQIQPAYVQENANRVQSNEPMELARINVDRNLYGDKQSRLIQRINKFKTASNSLLMRPDAHYFDKQADKQEYFRTTNDKTLINHRKMKQLQTINKYKQQHKTQYMQKIFDQALQKYSLQNIQLGVPKYLIYYFEKQKSGHERILVKPILKIIGQSGQQQIRKQVEIKIIDKKIVQNLMSKSIIKLKQHASYDIEITQIQKNNTIIDIYDNRVAIVLKIMIYPTKQIQQILEQEQSKLRLDICLRIDSESGQLLSEQVYKLKPIKLITQYEMSYHNYEYQQQLIEIPINLSLYKKYQQYEQIINNMQVIASHDVQYRISNNKDKLDIKVKYPKIKIKTINKDNFNSKDITNHRQIQITLLDSHMRFLLAAYKVKLYSYHQMKQIQTYQLGSICKYCFDLTIDQEIYPLINQQTNKNSLLNSNNNLKSKSKSSLVGFFTSHPNQCSITCNSKQQLIIQDSQVYKIQLVYQSFTFINNQQSSQQDRIVINMIDLNSNIILKKWLLKIDKTFEDYKSVYQIKIQKNKQLKFRYLLKNKFNKQTHFKFYSSNYSILTVPQYAIILNQNQQTNVDFSFVVKKQDLSMEEKTQGIHVIMRVESNNLNGWNQLFRIFLQ